MKSYDPASPLISLHIPKTGGSSLVRALERWFPAGRLIKHYRGKSGGLPVRHTLQGPVCVHGHFNAARGFGVAQYYPQVDQFMTFLREPFDRFQSLWFFLNRMKREGRPVEALDGDPDFQTFLHLRAAEQMQNRNSYSFVWQFPDVANHTDIGDLMDRRFVFVGIMERYRESLDALAAVLGKPKAPAVHFNKTKRADNACEAWRPFYEKHFAAEFEIYEAALARNADLIQRYQSQRPASIGEERSSVKVFSLARRWLGLRGD